MTPLQFTRSVRSLNRLRRVAVVLTQHGFGHIVSRLNLTRFVPVWMMRVKSRLHPKDEQPASLGRRIADVCSELGPTFIKLGQTFSTRPDIIPQEVLAELQRLQDDVPPFDTAAAMAIVSAELGRPIDACFSGMEEQPVASGSIGQVYRARTLEGAEVMVKVRRPGVEDVIRVDMQIMHWLAETLEHVVPEIRPYRPRMIVSELEETLTRELDFVGEAATTARFLEAFSDQSVLRIPKVYWDLTGPRVLTIGALEGVNLSVVFRGEPSQPSRYDRPLLARRLADAYLRQVFELGFFHADPHPGNLLVEPPATIGLIDFGQASSISDELVTQLIVMVYAAVKREVGVVVDSLADLGALGRDTDTDQLHHDLRLLLDKYYGLPIKRIDLMVLLSEFSKVVRRHDVLVPKEAVVLFKTAGTVASITNELDPDFNLLEVLKPRIERAIQERVAPARLLRGAALTGWHVLNLLRKAPWQLREGLRRAAAGRWQLNVRHENIERLINELDRSSNRLAISIVIGAVIVGSSVVLAANTTMTLFNVQVQNFGLAGYLLAGVMGMALIWAIFRSGRLH